MKKLSRLMPVLLGILFLSSLFFIPVENNVQAGYDCSYSNSSSDIPEDTSDKVCVDKYYACQDENADVRKEWGNCTGWGGDPDVLGCHAYTREAWLINPTLCPKGYINDKQFQEDYSWGQENYKYCQCVEACGPEPTPKDCFPVLEKCCATLVEEEPEPEIEKTILEPEPEQVETETFTPLITETPESKPPVDCPTNSTYQNNKCVCNSGYMPNPQETCCAQELSAKARLTKIQNLYYEKIPKGITTSGKLNNIYSVFDGKYEKYACGSYQSMILEFLDGLRYSDDCEESALLKGFDYGPIEAFYKWHQATVLYPAGTDWIETGLVLDPWPNQKPEIFTIDDWGVTFSGGGFWGIRGSSVYTDSYPTVGGSYKDPAIFDIKSGALRSFLQSLPAKKQTQFKDLSSYQKRSYMYWQGKKSAVRVHVHSPVDVVITDQNNKRIGQSASGDYYDETDNIYMRTQQMADGHYTYDIYMPAGQYDLKLTGNDDGSVTVVSAITDGDSYSVRQGQINVKKGKKIDININAVKKTILADGIKFNLVSKANEIKNIPEAKQATFSGGISGWYDQNWDQYFEAESNSNIWIWILYGVGALIFIGALILAVILLVFKKKFIIVLLIFMLIMLFSCTASGIATYLLYSSWTGDKEATVKDINTIQEEYVEETNTAEIADAYNEDTTSDSKAEQNNDTATDYTVQGLIFNKDYNFTLDVGKKYASKFRLQKNVNEGFVTDSYAYCYDTKENYEDDVFCRSGEINLFTVDVMTQKQWSDMFTDDYSLTPFDMGYQVMTDKGGMIYAYSHINGILPDDAPTGNNYYEDIPQSIKFVSN